MDHQYWSGRTYNELHVGQTDTMGRIVEFYRSSQHVRTTAQNTHKKRRTYCNNIAEHNTLKCAPRFLGSPCGPVNVDSQDMKCGQIFQMDPGFIRGPDNLEAVVDRTARIKPRLIQSRQGYMCYLLIIDRKSQYLWVFPQKTKAIPPDVLQTCFKTNGLAQSTPNLIIRTDGEGALAESARFRTDKFSLGYTIQKTAMDASSQNGMVKRPHQMLATMV